MRNVIFIAALLLSLCAKAGDVKVEFITPTIVRVQWSADGSLPGNGTGACIYQKQKEECREIQSRDKNQCRQYQIK